MALRSTRFLISVATAGALGLASLGAAGADPGAPPASSASAARATGYAVVMLDSPPAAQYRGGRPGLPATAPRHGQLDPDSPAYRAYRRHLAREHAAFKSHLRSQAPRARVVREYFAVANAVAVELNGTSMAALARGPKVRRASASWTYRPTMNVSNDLIGSPEAWTALGGQETAGEGVQVAVIDTGIDLANPFFADDGLPARPQVDRCDDQDDDPATPDTNNKVVVCRVFASGVSGLGKEPELFFDHGTHVAGTVGGRAGTAGTVAGTDVELTDLSGVAPGVTLGSYNVFPGYGGGFVAFDGSAFSHDIAAALEQAVLDGMDVANLSIGGSVQGPHDFLAEAADAAVDAGMVVVAAAGNSGPGDSTVESPGTAAKVVTVGASTNPHFVGIPVAVTAGPAAPAEIGAATGDFATFDPAVTADYTVTQPADGCSAITEDLTGRIALIDRGTCAFTVKVRNAEAAGAVGVLVVNNSAGDPTAMGHDGTNPLPSIPAAMVGMAEGESLKPAGTVTVDGTAPQEILSDNADIMAAFSSRGPSPFTGGLKPDLVAPGVNIASSVFGGEFAFLQGTSMASPHVAGVAALLLDRFPDASPAEVKSRMASTAARVVTDHATGTQDPGPLARGGGRVDVPAAFGATTWLAPVSVSFGRHQGRAPVDETRTVQVHGSPATSATVGFTQAPPPGVSVTATVSEAGDAVQVSLRAGRTVPGGDYSGDVAITTADGETLLVPFWVRLAR